MYESWFRVVSSVIIDFTLFLLGVLIAVDEAADLSSGNS
jgi:hypothetical protein